jgi:hypothetical protein
VRALHAWLIPGLVMAWFLGCPGDEQHDDDDDDDESCCDDDTYDDDEPDDDPAQIVLTRPVEGATDVYHRDPILVEFDAELPSAAIELRDADGTLVSCEVTVEERPDRVIFDPHGDDPVEHLLPDTDYTATIEWPGDAFELHFRTSTLGTPLTAPDAALEGQDYAREVAAGWFIDPYGMDVVMEVFGDDFVPVLHVQEVRDEDGRIEAYGAVVARVEGELVQDLCSPTLAMDTEGATLGDWANPWAQFGPLDLQALDYTPGPGSPHTSTGVVQWTGSATFSPGGTELLGHIEALVDTRAWDTLIDPHGGGGEGCDLLEALGIDCEDCPDGTGAHCLRMTLLDVPGTVADVQGVQPETGEVLTGLTEVTAQTLADWQAGGYCL